LCHLDDQRDLNSELISLVNKFFKNKEGKVGGTYEVRNDIWRNGGKVPFSCNLQHCGEVNVKHDDCTHGYIAPGSHWTGVWSLGQKKIHPFQ